MKAIILCGGQGTRLREHTEVQPKPMVEIGGRPILWHIMKLYAFHGITDFVLCLGLQGQRHQGVLPELQGNELRFHDKSGKEGRALPARAGLVEDHWCVTVAETGESTMTGYAHLPAKYLQDDETFMVTYGDGLSDVNLRAVLEFHKEHGRLATMTGVRPPSRFGELQCEGSRVVAFSEKPQIGQGLINGGFFCFQRGFLKYLSESPDCVLERSLESCAADGQLSVFEHLGYWQCMDTYRDWMSLESQWQSGNALESVAVGNGETRCFATSLD